jgi:hypothetical protein
MENISHTVYPDQQLSFDEWAKETKASSAYIDRTPIYNANKMNKEYDEDKLNKYFKQLMLTV